MTEGDVAALVGCCPGLQRLRLPHLAPGAELHPLSELSALRDLVVRSAHNREKASLIERVALYTDWYWAITFDKKLQQTPYLYVMKPKVDDKGEKDAAAAELTKQSMMREICERVSEVQQRQEGVSSKIDKLETKIEKQDALNSQMNSKINSKINRLKMQMNRLEEKLIQLIDMQTASKQ